MISVFIHGMGVGLISHASSFILPALESCIYMFSYLDLFLVPCQDAASEAPRSKMPHPQSHCTPAGLEPTLQPLGLCHHCQPQKFFFLSRETINIEKEVLVELGPRTVKF